MAKCKNCGKRNPFHTCYTGGSRTSMDIDAKTLRNIHRTVELNVARGHDPYKGLSSSHRKVYLSQDRDRQ